MGMTLAFNTQAKPGPTRRIFENSYSLTALNVGEALCRIRSEARTRKIVAWGSRNVCRGVEDLSILRWVHR